MNLFIGIGRLGDDPVGKTFVNPKTNKEEDVANFSIAIDEGYGNSKKTEWVNCVCFGSLAKNVCQYMAKGGLIAVKGKLKKSSYKGKDGQMVYKTEIVVNEQKFLTFGKGNAMPTPEEPSSDNTNSSPAASNDGFMDIPDGIEKDLPFR